MAVELLDKTIPLTLPKVGKTQSTITGTDVAQLIRAVGLPCIAFWDVRWGLSRTAAGVVTSWRDVRWSLAGNLLPGSGPTINSDGSITFDGVANYLRATGGLSGVTSDCALITVMKGQTSITGRAAELSTGATASIVAGQQAAGPQWSSGTLANANMLANAASPQILHARRKVNTAFGSQVGANVEVTAASVGANSTADRFTLGANRLDVAAAFAPIVGLRAVIIFAGDYTGKQALVNAWAQTYHNAVP